MSKQINQHELATLVNKLLTQPEAVGELDTDGKFADFMTDIAKVVCDHCGGEVSHEASFLDDVCYVSIEGNDSLPEGGGVWKDFDKGGEL
jgi:hypothetical protein